MEIKGGASSPAVFEAARNWNTYHAIRDDIRKLLTLPSDVAKFRVFYGGIPAGKPLGAPRKWLGDVDKEPRRDHVALIAPDEWFAGYPTPKDTEYPNLYVIMARVEPA